MDRSSERNSDPRNRDPRQAENVDPKSGKSDDPRITPSPNGDGTTSSNRSPGDQAWQNELTDETMPPPADREDAAETLRLDPTDEA